jgi:uncharacterized membrane protein
VLIPVAVWLFATYTLVGTSNQYIAVSFLFLIAYLERKKPLLAGVLLGLSASIIQLVWFAIPFFLVLVLREEGSKNMLKCLAAGVVAFMIIGSYFIIISPNIFLEDIFSLFGLSKLSLYGSNVMQLLESHYYVASWYPAAISAITLLAALALYYFYTKTLKPLVAVLPAMIFFLSWRNISIYGLPFIPVIIAIYYVHESRQENKLVDLIKDKRPIVYAVVFLVILFAAMAVYSHAVYTKNPILEINSVLPILYGQPGFVGPFSLGGIRINVANNGGSAEPVSFYIVSRSPGGEQYLLSTQLNASVDPQMLPAHTSHNYTIPYQLSLVGNSTKIYIFAFSPDYITSKEYQINLVR